MTPGRTIERGDGRRFEIRRIRAEDWRTLRDVRLASLRDAPSAFLRTVEEEAAHPDGFWRERAAANASGEPVIGYLAWELDLDGGERCVGLIGAKALGEPPERREIVGMWVAPRARGCGVGDGLIGVVAELCAAEGRRALSLWVATDNGPATGLYRRNGFRETGAEQPVERFDAASGERRPSGQTEMEMSRGLGGMDATGPAAG